MTAAAITGDFGIGRSMMVLSQTRKSAIQRISQRRLSPAQGPSGQTTPRPKTPLKSAAAGRHTARISTEPVHPAGIYPRPWPRKQKTPGQAGGSSLYLVPEIGIEPTTYALRMRRSTN
jgi:hypothetical protein